MAERLSSKTAPTADNEKARDDAIRECAAEFQRIADARKELNEEATEVRERLRDLGIDPNAFKHVEKLRDMDDQGRNKFMGDLSRVFGVLGLGGQLDWIDAVVEQSEAEAAE